MNQEGLAHSAGVSLVILLFLAGPPAGCAEAPADEAGVPPGGEEIVLAPEALEEVSLLVYVVVDQLRADLLDRYDGVFTGGLRRLADEALHFSNATYDHAETSTSPGHATASTGTHPHRHGLVGNSWREQQEDGSWESVYALRDLSAEIVGHPGMEGRGPANLERDGLADWISTAEPDARIVSLSGKDRAAIAMAGRARGEVYWLESGLGRFVTSTYYREAYPGWLEAFNRDEMPRIWSETVWRSTVPEWAWELSRPDTFPYEGDGDHTYFPHRAEDEAGDGSERAVNVWRGRGPWPDAAVLALARRSVEALELGRRGPVDYLALSLSQVDRVGHDYGPLSREQLDNLVRLDRELGDFLEFLDDELGEDGWLLALTSDHGVIEIPEARGELGLHGRRISPGERRDLVGRATAAWEAAGEDPRERARAAARVAAGEDWIEDAFAWEDLLSGEPGDSLRALFVRSYHPDRALGLLGHLGAAFRTAEGVYSGRYPTGTGHGSPYHYDRHVPFVLRLPGVPGGRRDRPVSVVDLAPTLATLLRIPHPDDLDGRAVLRVGTGGR